jgi:hypothetical protein
MQNGTNTNTPTRTRLAAAFVLLAAALTAVGVAAAGADAEPPTRPGASHPSDDALAPELATPHADAGPAAIGDPASDPVGASASADSEHGDEPQDAAQGASQGAGGDGSDGDPDGDLPVIVTPPPLPIPPVDMWHPEDIIIGGVVPDPDPDPIELPDLAPLPKVVAGLAGPIDIKHGSGCQVSCIVSGVAHARGTGASLTVETDTPAKIWITVSNGSFSRTAFSGDERTTEFTADFDDLEPGTGYHAKVRAQDAALHLDEAEGEFETLRRHVRVQFGGVNVVEVADEGDFDFYFRVDGEWRETFSFTHWPYPYHHPLGGSKVVEIADAPAHLDVGVQVFQSRKTKKNDVCEGFDRPTVEPAAGQDTCRTWVSAPEPGSTISLDASPHDGDGPEARSFTMILESEGQHGMNVRAIVSFDVWYE